MSQRESRLSKSIQSALRERGYFCWKVWGSDYQMAGLPDIIICAKGIFIGLEVKMPESRDNVSAIQQHRHRQIRRAGGAVSVVCSVKEALAVVEQALSEWEFE